MYPYILASPSEKINHSAGQSTQRKPVEQSTKGLENMEVA